MENKHPIEAILKKWDSRKELHEDARAANPQLDLIAVHRWFQRKSIPSQYDSALVAGARRRGFSLDYAELAMARASQSEASA